MYSYTDGSCSGSPHSSHSPTVSGSEGSRIVVSASTKGTPAMIARNRSGARFATAPISSPPALRPSAPSRAGSTRPLAPRCSAAATKSLKEFFFSSSLPWSYQSRPISPPPRTCAIAMTTPRSRSESRVGTKDGSIETS